MFTIITLERGNFLLHLWYTDLHLPSLIQSWTMFLINIHTHTVHVMNEWPLRVDDFNHKQMTSEIMCCLQAFVYHKTVYYCEDVLRYSLSITNLNLIQISIAVLMLKSTDFTLIDMIIVLKLFARYEKFFNALFSF